LWQVRYGADVRSLLPELTTPTLVIHSARARVIPRVYGLYLAESIPGAEFVEIDSTDQSPFTEPADEIAERIVTFAHACTK
jgi:pimeloyl-ACP methyl ester carboxylesterase